MDNLKENQVYFSIRNVEGKPRYTDTQFTKIMLPENDFCTKDGLLERYNTANDFEYNELVQKEHNLYSNIVTGFTVDLDEFLIGG